MDNEKAFSSSERPATKIATALQTNIENERLGKQLALQRVQESATAVSRFGTARSFDTYDAQLRSLFRYLRDEKTVTGATVYRDALAQTETEMRQACRGQIPDLLRSHLASLENTADRDSMSEARRLVAILLNLLPQNAVQSLHTEGGKLTFQAADGSRWQISANDSGLFTLRNELRSDEIVSLDQRDFVDAVESKRLDAAIAEARTNAKSERDGKSALENYDLPRSGDIVHIRLFPETSHDEVAESNFSTAAFLSLALQHRYGDRLKVTPLLLTDHPRQALRELIAESCRKWRPKAFIIDIFQHGTKDQIDFATPLKAADFAFLAQTCPNSEARFQIGTVACYGGGLRQGMRNEIAKDPTLAHRMAVFLQTKPNIQNISAMYESSKGRTQWSTLYYARLALALYDGKSYGQAVAIADQYAKEHSGRDAEALIGNQLIAKRESWGDRAGPA